MAVTIDAEAVLRDLEPAVEMLSELKDLVDHRILTANEFIELANNITERIYESVPEDSIPYRVCQRKYISLINSKDYEDGIIWWFNHGRDKIIPVIHTPDVIAFIQTIDDMIAYIETNGIKSKLSDHKHAIPVSKSCIDPPFINDLTEVKRNDIARTIHVSRENPKEHNVSDKKQVFVIYGHDDATKTKVEVLLHRIGVQPVIFSQLPNRGSKTNIEILEENLPIADAVVAILTPDDEGRKKGTTDLEPRARQNVLIEAGYALISKRRASLIVAVGGVTIPSDFDGINRIQSTVFDRAAEIDLARQLAGVLGLTLDIIKV